MSRTATMLLDLMPVAVTLGIDFMRMDSHALVFCGKESRLSKFSRYLF